MTTDSRHTYDLWDVDHKAKGKATLEKKFDRPFSISVSLSVSITQSFCLSRLVNFFASSHF